VSKLLIAVGVAAIICLTATLSMIPLAGCAGGPAEEEGEIEVVEWAIQHTRGPATYNSEALKGFAQIVSQRTNGGFKITIYDSQGLNIPWDEGLETCSTGAVPIFVSPTSYFGGLNQFFLAETLAGLINSVEAHSMYTAALFDLRAKVLAEYDVRELAHWPFDKQVWAAKKPLPKPEDFKDTRLRVASPDLAYIVDGLDGLPITMGFNEIYVAMQRGAMDGFCTGVGAMHGISAWEIADYLTDMTMSQAGEIVIVNNEAYEALPRDYRAILQEESYALQMRMYYLTKTMESEEQAFLISKGMTYVEASPELRKAILEIGAEYLTKWAQEGGPDCLEAYQLAQAIGYAK